MRIPGKIVTAAAAALVLSACTPFYEEPSTEPPGRDATPTIAGAPASAAPSSAPNEHAGQDECKADDFKVDGAPGKKPKVTVPKDCAPPAKLLRLDLDEGNGPAVKKGDNLQVHYTLFTFSDGKEVESSWDGGQPLPVENIGEAELIQGWNEGLIGVKEGGRRLLIIPPDKGYGEQGNQGINPNETLVFVIGVTSIG